MKRRAGERNGNKTLNLSTMQVPKHNDATIVPTRSEELHTFKAVVRDTTRHEASHEDGELFKAESEMRSEGLLTLVP